MEPNTKTYFQFSFKNDRKTDNMLCMELHDKRTHK